MAVRTERIGIKVGGVLYDLSEILDLYYDKELIVEFKNKKEKDYFTMTEKEAQYYIQLFRSTFDKIYE